MIETERVSSLNGFCDLCQEPISKALGVRGYDLVLETTCKHGDQMITVAPEPFAYCENCEKSLGSPTIENILKLHRLVMLPLIMQIETVQSYRISILVDGLLYSDTP